LISSIINEIYKFNLIISVGPWR